MSYIHDVVARVRQEKHDADTPLGRWFHANKADPKAEYVSRREILTIHEQRRPLPRGRELVLYVGEVTTDWPGVTDPPRIVQFTPGAPPPPSFHLPAAEPYEPPRQRPQPMPSAPKRQLTMPEARTLASLMVAAFGEETVIKALTKAMQAANPEPARPAPPPTAAAQELPPYDIDEGPPRQPQDFQFEHETLTVPPYGDTICSLTVKLGDKVWHHEKRLHSFIAGAELAEAIQHTRRALEAAFHRYMGSSQDPTPPAPDPEPDTKLRNL